MSRLVETDDQLMLLADELGLGAKAETTEVRWTEAELLKRSLQQLPAGELLLEAARVLEGRRDTRTLGKAVAEVARRYRLPFAGDFANADASLMVRLTDELRRVERERDHLHTELGRAATRASAVTAQATAEHSEGHTHHVEVLGVCPALAERNARAQERKAAREAEAGG